MRTRRLVSAALATLLLWSGPARADHQGPRLQEELAGLDQAEAQAIQELWRQCG